MSPLTLPRPLGSAGSLSKQGMQPVQPPRAHGSGSAPFRLLAGGEVFAGHGVLTHDLALAGCVARGVASRTRHGADVELISGSVKRFLTTRSTTGGRDLRHFDGAILHVDRAVLREAGQQASKLRERLSALRLRLGPRAVVVIVVDSIDLTVTHTTATDFADAIHPIARVVVLPTTATKTVTELYARWGAEIAQVLSEDLRYPQLWVDPVEPLDESARQKSVDALGSLDEEWDDTFHRIVNLARAAYGTKNAAVSVIDRGTTVYTGRAAPSITGPQQRSQSVCSQVLHTYGGVIAPDLRLDSRFSALASVVAGEARFYAGYRVCAPDGQPVAALCVFDDMPRQMTSDDIATLRDFAISAERQLWGLMVARSTDQRNTGTDSRFGGWI